MVNYELLINDDVIAAALYWATHRLVKLPRKVLTVSLLLQITVGHEFQTRVIQISNTR